MKKTIFVLSMAVVLLASGMSIVVAQEQPKPKKDTVNMDTDAKPTFYYAVEDEKSGAKSSSNGSSSIIIIVAGAVVVLGGVAFFLLRKKK
jgi:LPXTG-motif cell wall-anchored protein